MPAALAGRFFTTQSPGKAIPESVPKACNLYIYIYIYMFKIHGLPGGSMVKNLSATAGDAGFIPGSGRYPGEGNGNPLQDSCLGNPLDGEAWWATVYG